MNFVIDPMRPEDWERVRSILLQGINTGNATFEVDAPSWEEWDKAHLPVCRLVARSEGVVVGWAALAPVSIRKAYAGVAEASLYIDQQFRGKGLGTALQLALIRESEAQGIWTLQGTVLAENEPSLALLRKGGFRVVGRRERISKLHGVWRDTLILERRSPVAGRD